jgi:hypothetical protein
MIKRVVLTTLLFAFAGNCLSAQAQFRPPSYPNDRIDRGQFRAQFQDYLNNLQRKTARLKDSINRDLDRGPTNNSRREDNINQRMDDFKREVDRLRDRFKDNKPIRDNINAVIRYRSLLENTMQMSFVSSNSRQNWTDLRPDLVKLESIARGGNGRYNQGGVYYPGGNGGYNQGGNGGYYPGGNGGYNQGGNGGYYPGGNGRL